MANIKSTLDFDQRLQHMTDAAKDFKKRFYTWPFSIEIASGGNPEPYITFVTNTWSTGYAREVQDFCDKHDLGYTITPVGERLAVTLSINR